MPSKLMSGGQDGLVKTWQVVGPSLVLKNTIDIKTPAINSVLSEVISVCFNDAP
jgi:hypothetical protein